MENKVDWRTDLGLPQETEIIGDYYLNYFNSCLDIYQHFVNMSTEKDLTSGFLYYFAPFSIGHFLYSTLEFQIAEKHRCFYFSFRWYDEEVGELEITASKQFGKPKTDSDFLEMCKEYNIAVEKFKSYLQDIEYMLGRTPDMLINLLGTMQVEFRDYRFKIKFLDSQHKAIYKV